MMDFMHTKWLEPTTLIDSDGVDVSDASSCRVAVFVA